MRFGEGKRLDERGRGLTEFLDGANSGNQVLYKAQTDDKMRV